MEINGFLEGEDCWTGTKRCTGQCIYGKSIYEWKETGTGSAIHVYNEEGEEVLTYTGGVGWQEKETKAESQVHSALKITYYEAFSEARKALNSEEKTGSAGENIIMQDNFDM